MKEKILITSSSTNADEYVPVKKGLETLGHLVVNYDSDRVVEGTVEFSVEISKEGECNIAYDGEDISPGNVAAAWYRKVSDFTKDKKQIRDRAGHLLFLQEIGEFHDTIWSQYPDDVWLNAPDIMFTAAQKLTQLRTAKAVGFEIPETMVSTNWDQISNMMSSHSLQGIIVKMLRGVLIESDIEKAFACTRLRSEQIEELKELTNPFPGLYQPFIEKAREWRVTVVGENVFPVAIYTDKEAKDDWRKHQMSGAVNFKKGKLPDETEKMCTDYLVAMSLGFGAFDLVERSDGSIVFLECNTNGQYKWLEDMLDLKICDAIIDELDSIATNR